MRSSTTCEVGAATQRDALIDYMAREYGWKIDTMTKAELEKRVDDPSVPEPVRELLKLRLMSTKTSIQKFKALLRRVNKDGRMRGGLQFRGASRTGRWSGRGFQGQNLARPTVSQKEIDFATKVLKQRDGTFECFYDDPSVILPNLLRGEIITPAGKKLIVADYSNVEGRVLAWLAGEEWKLQAFRDFDAGHGHDLYKLAYAKAFGVKPEDVTKPQRQIGKVLELALGYGGGAPAFARFAKAYGIDLSDMAFGVKPEDVTKPQRQIGKVLELALGYGGGAPAFARFAKAYGIDLSDMAEYVKSTAPRAVWLEAVDGYPYFVEKNRTGGLEREAFIACDVLKRLWRKTNPKIVQFWANVGQAVQKAIVSRESVRVGYVAFAFIACDVLKRLWRKTNPKIVQFWANVGQAVQKAIVSRESVRVGYVAFARTESFLVIRLPSGRLLCYPSPKTNPSVGKDSFTYAGTNQFSRKWEKIESYGAKACIAAGTPVLCRNGWTPIEDVTPLDEVWDGVEWVSQFGPVNNGTRECIKAYGVWMTPDHKVLTVEGWKDAASQFDRAEVRLPNSCFRGRVASTEEAGMEVHMQCVRQCQDANNGRTSMEGKTPVCHGLRVPPRPFAKFWIEDPRHVAIAALPYLLRDDKSVLRSFYEGLCAVRRSGHYCLRPVARVVRELLGGYGGRLRRQPNAGQEGQLRALLARKLPVGVCREASQQPTEHRFVPREADSRMGPRVGHIEKHHFESHSSRLPGTPSTAQGQIAKEVFDLTNCGPRHRFVVLGEEGPLIVHNCENITQAVACDLLSEGLLRMDAAGYKTVLTIHDEAITEAPDTDEFTFKKMEHLMSTLPDWAPGLPLVAAGYEAYRYRKD